MKVKQRARIKVNNGDRKKRKTNMKRMKKTRNKVWKGLSEKDERRKKIKQER